MKIAILISLAGFQWAAGAAACRMVEGDHILAADFAALNPAFAALDPKRPLAVTPMPAVPRLFRPEEIVRIARVHGVAVDSPVSEMCFERAVETLTPAKLLPVLRGALGIEDARIEILDFSRYGVPAGTIEFTRAGLHADRVSATEVWRGQVVYSQGRSVAIWVKARITTEQTWVEAAGPLAMGKAIGGAQVVIRTGPKFPFGTAALDSIDRAVGRAPIRAIKAGEQIFASMLTAPREVERGDTVHVEVVSGEAKLLFDATAETSGRLGELVLIKNPDNGRHFQARVGDKGKVVVTR